MIARLLLFFVILPFVEIFAFRMVYTWLRPIWGGQMAVELIILALIVAGYAGIKIMKYQSARIMRGMRGGVPTDMPVDRVIMLVGGVLLLIPGFVTDAAALLILFLPPLRHVLARRMGVALLSRFQRRSRSKKGDDSSRGDQTIIDVEATDRGPA